MPMQRNIKRIPEEYTEQVGSALLANSLENNMKNGLGTLSWINIKSALMFALLSAVAITLAYIIGTGDVFSLDLRIITNIFSLSLANGLLSIIKSLGTTNEGKFVGVQTVDK